MLAELRPLWRIAWPLLIAQTAQIGTGVVDTLMAGNYGDVDLAAIAVGFNIWLPLYLIILGAIRLLGDRGARFWRGAHGARAQFSSAGALGGGGAKRGNDPLCLNSNLAIALLGLPEETAAKTSAYVSRVGLGFPALGIFMALRYHTQGLGITAPFAFASVVGFIANVPLNYMLIFGAWGAPELGAEGCGLATAASMWISTLIILLYVLTARSLQPYLPNRWFEGPDWGRISEILVVGFPVGLTFFWKRVFFGHHATDRNTRRRGGGRASNRHQCLGRFLHSHGQRWQCDGNSHGPCHRRTERARRAHGASGRCRSSTLIGLLAMSLLLLFPDAIIGAYTQSEDIRDLALRLLRLARYSS